MIRILLVFFALSFSVLVKGGVSMDLKNMRYNDQYDFYRDVNEIYKSDYFSLNLMKFIKINLEFLGLKRNVEDLSKIENIKFEFHLPKKLSSPILKGVIDYTIIIYSPSRDNLGKYFSYHSWISRDAADKPWNKA
ncbi:hypothetical protein HYE60_00715, partial [Aggregatibacter actinomycetemcomitans]|uniref:hypothetical protein n=1 Tax=Aggregatibacter actinomycetemcomitans TaxID=714 RepID=UPI00197C4E84